jgi:hypothetical protein
MAVARQQVTAKGLSRSFPVICDGGTWAGVVVLRLEQPPPLGFSFHAFGRLWQVVKGATATRGAVARPLEPARSREFGPAGKMEP